MRFDRDEMLKRARAGAQIALRNFDAGAVCAVMHALNWQWPTDDGPRVPTSREVERKAAELLDLAVDKFVESCGAEDSYIATGGLVARVSDYAVTITFEAVVGEAFDDDADGEWGG